MSETNPSVPAETVSSSALERRVFVRYAADHLTAACRSTEVHDPGWIATVQDISSGGLGLLLRHRFRPGTPLKVELRRTDGTQLRELRVRVVYTAPVHADGEFAWRVGCAFITELTDDELRSLLK
jgi:hypothetical protein